MKHKHLALTLGAIITSLLLIISCKKINESTTLGGDLIPEVDNITTFDTTLTVEAFNDTFSLTTDSTEYGSTPTHYLGQISSDPFFGKTDAKLYLELKPSLFSHTFINRPDSLHIDSVVLVLDYVETYGDTTTSQTVNVYEIGGLASDFRYDTTYRLRENGIVKAGLLGSRTFQPLILNDSIKAYKDTTVNQLRIRLDDSFGQRLLKYDTTTVNGKENAYSTDSAFRSKFKGFALESAGGNALMGFNLNGANTKLAIYYKDDNGGKPADKWDTTFTYFTFGTRSASANLITRDHTGTPLAASANGSLGTPDDLIYIQATPGSFATIKIPALAGLSNRVVHRAELIMEQVHDPLDTFFSPTNLYLDAYDPTASNFRVIPYDVQFDQTGSPNLGSFGVNGVSTKDPSGKNIRSWRFNITRYVQHVVNDTEPLYNLRLSAPYYVEELYRPGAVGSTSTLAQLTVNSAAGKGRVRLAGNTGVADTNPQRMRLRIVYSKI